MLIRKNQNLYYRLILSELFALQYLYNVFWVINPFLLKYSLLIQLIQAL